MGRKLRCANPECRKTFRVTPQGEALPAVEKGAEAKTALQEANDWQSAPPPVAGGGYTSQGQDADWQAAAPPPRQGEWAPAADYTPNGEAPVFATEAAPAYATDGQAANGAYAEYGAGQYGYTDGAGDYMQYRRRSHKVRNIILAFIAFGVVCLGVIIYVVVSKAGEAQRTLEDQAITEFNRRDFFEAKNKFELLKQKYPGASSIPYEYYLQRCQIEQLIDEGGKREPKKLHEAANELEKAVNAWSDEKNPNNKLYAARSGEIWIAGMELASQALTAARGAEGRDPDPEYLQTADKALKLATAHATGVEEAQLKKRQDDIRAKTAKAQQAIAVFQTRKAFQEKLAEVTNRRSPTGIDDLYDLQRQYEQQFDAVRSDADLKKPVDDFFAAMKKSLDDLRKVEKDWVAYTDAPGNVGKPPAANEGISLITSAPLVTPSGKADAVKDEPIVLAVARGTLYGLSAINGEVRWSMRVGIDTQRLPARLPIRPDQPDLAYIVGQDTQGQHGLYCIDVKTGKVLWVHPLPIASTAGPALIGGRIYVPLLNGQLEIIDPGTGNRQGMFDFRQPLTLAPAWDKASNRLYVPAEQNRIFVLDLAPPAPEKPRCVEVIYTRHRAGSIRGGLVITPDALFFAEAVRADTMVVRSYALKGNQEAKDLDRVPGLAAYAPRFDDDTIALLSDKGYFDLFATNRNLPQEQPLSSLTGGALAVDWPEGTDPDSIQPLGPSQVVDVQLNDWSLLIGPWLYRKRFDPYRRQLVSGDTPRLRLGTALHAAALSPDSRYVITVTLLDNRVLATALNRVTGAIVWQRQLGALVTQEPIRLGDQVVVLDQSGSLGRIDTKQLPDKGSQWLILEDWPALPREQFASRLVLSPNGKLAMSYAYNPATRQLLLRQVAAGGGPATEQVVALSSPPWGTAALSDEGLLMVPCRDGNLREFSVARSSSSVTLNWRAPTAKSGSKGQALFLSPKILVASDGQRRLLRWNRNEDGSWRQVDAFEVPGAGNFTTPLVAVKPNEALTQVAVGDDRGAVHLVSVIGAGASSQAMADGGNITQGPVLLGQRRLGWVKETREGRQLVLWEIGANQASRYPSMPIKDEFVGVPQQIGELILVAEQGNNAGRVSWVLPNGSMVRQVAFNRNLTPTAGGIALDAKYALVPLSDAILRLVEIPQK
jgi:outer membrane protein assembly factor BamB